jgi:hypothetical protein
VYVGSVRIIVSGKTRHDGARMNNKIKARLRFKYNNKTGVMLSVQREITAYIAAPTKSVGSITTRLYCWKKSVGYPLTTPKHNLLNQNGKK